MILEFEITEQVQVINHGLGTRALIVQAWQNDYLVQPDVQHVGTDENEIRVVGIGITEKNPVRLVIAADDKLKPKTSKEKTSGSKKNTGTKRTTKAS